MHDRTYTDGVTFGLDAYLYERQFYGTFASPQVTGYLSACAAGGTFFAGVLHGLALGAAYHLRQRDATTALRAAP